MKTRLQKTLTALLLLFVIKATHAQTNTWQWAKSAGATGNEATTGSVVDASGNVYVVGWYTSATITFGTITLTNPGNFTADMFIAKYDASGNVLWAKTFGGVDGEIGNGIAIDASGNIYVTGWFASSAMTMDTYTITNAGTTGSDMLVAKLDANGNTLWAKSGGGTGGDRGLGVAVDASNNVFVSGGFNSSSISFGSGGLTNAGTNTSDVFIVKYNASGNVQWAQSAGGSANDLSNGVATDSLGNAYLTGYFSSSTINFGTGIINNNTVNAQDIFVAKYNGSGTAVWAQRAGGSMDDYANAIAIRGNRLYITGGFNSASIAVGTTTLNNNSAGTSDFILAKYDLNGNAQWATEAGDVDSEAGNGIATDAAGNVFVTGYYISTTITFGINTLTNAAAGYRDLFVAAYTSNGFAAWANTATAATYDETANAVAVTASGSDVYVGGSFNSAIASFGAHNLYKGCGDDVFVAKLTGTTVGIKENKLHDQLALYPNPTSGKFTVEGEGQIIFYNVLGEEVRNEKVNKHQTFDFSSQAKGVYVYKIISTDKKVYSGRVVVE